MFFRDGTILFLSSISIPYKPTHNSMGGWPTFNKIFDRHTNEGARPFAFSKGGINEGQSEKLVGAIGFEPTTPCAQGRCATRLRYAPT